jgi:hypothetical protein
MLRPTPPNYAYLHVSQDINGGRECLREIEAQCIKYAGEQGLGATTEVRLDGVRVSQARSPYYELAKPSELNLVLLHRGVNADLKTRFALGSAKRELEEGAYARSSRFRSPRFRDQPKTLGEAFHGITQKYAARLALAGEGVIFDRVVEISNVDLHDPNVSSDRLLALAPADEQVANEEIDELVKTTKERFEMFKPRRVNLLPIADGLVLVARIPPASVLPSIDHDHLLEAITNDVLPVRLTRGQFRITDDGAMSA